ncbi:MAG: response regulator transcription factor, partial [Oscillospiraceae bacterium]|nr:response regulator transcription factor [Oscillospiraceae bacterium]
NGIELARKLRNRGDMLPIIFITGYSEFMQQGFDVEALHYLLKPLDRDKLFEVLDRYAKRHTNDTRIVVRRGDESVCISTSDIVCLEAFGKKTQIRLSDGSTILSDCGLGAVSEKLGETFISCHRSYIVNLAYIRSISRTDVTLDSGENVPLSRRSYDSVNRAFISYYAEKGQS